MSEIVGISPMTFEQARAAVDAIRRDVDDLIARIVELHDRRAWIALGYASWAEMCAVEFPYRCLPRTERPGRVVQLRAAGMSTRAIAVAVDADPRTVRDDLRDAGAVIPPRSGGGNPPPAIVTGLDGKTYPSTTPAVGAKVESIRTMAALGVNAGVIGEAVGLSEGRVYALAKANGIAVGKRSRAARAERIERTRILAGEGATSQQIADELGVAAHVVRKYSREHGIEIPADAVTMVRTMDSVRIVTAAIDVLDGIDTMFGHIDYATLPGQDVDGWVGVLDASIRSLTTLRKRLKELTQP
jgi:DNA-binding CsgD family transcriptional regulator